MSVVQNFQRDGESAANFAFSLVKLHSESKNISKKLYLDYTKPYSVPKTVCIFDIDDTLIKSSNSKPIGVIVDLFKKLNDPKNKINPDIYIITGRIDDKDYIKETRKQLAKIGIDNFTNLIHAPDNFRQNLPDLALWKNSERIVSKTLSDAPYIVLTVGDMWGDLLPLKTEKEIDALESKYGDDSYILIRPNDNVSLWALKLPAFAKNSPRRKISASPKKK